jgi:hypothetical protein
MFWISSEVSVLPVFESREWMRRFIKNLRFLTDGQVELDCDKKQRCDNHDTIHSGSKARGWTDLELLNDLLSDRTINVSLPFSEGLARPRQKPRNAIELLVLLGRGLIDKRSCLHDL